MSDYLQITSELKGFFNPSSIYTQMDKSELWLKKDVLGSLLFCFADKETEAQKA